MLRFTELRTAVGGVAPKVLTQTLRAMERDGLTGFFDVWGVYASDRCLGGYCDGVKVYVNGKLAPDEIIESVERFSPTKRRN